MRTDRNASAPAFLVAPLLLALAVAAHAQVPTCPGKDEWPAKLRLDYQVTASRGPFSINGDSVLSFERTGQAYSITVDTDAVGIYHARQTSRGAIGPDGLQPAEYVETRTGKSAQTTTFDWAAKVVRFSTAPDSPAPTETGLQDRVSLLVQLALRLHAATAEGPLEIPVAGARAVGPYRLLRRGVETVKVPVGEVEAAQFERALMGDDHDRLEAWFSPRWCGLPVRLRYVDKNGGVIDHRLRGASVE